MLNKLTYIANLLAASPRKYLIILINLLSASAIFFGYPLMITALEIFISNDVINSNYSLIDKYFTYFNIEPSFSNIIILSMALILTGQIFILTAQLIIQNAELILRKKYLKDLVHGYQKSSWEWIVKDESGRFHSAINREVNLASAAHLLSLKFVSSFIQLIGYIVVSIFISLNATLIAISIFIG